MHTVIIFDSEYGNTREISEAIAAELRAAGPVDIAKVRTHAAASVPADMDLLVVGAPTHMHHVSAPMRGYLENLPAKSLAGLEAAAFDTRAQGWRLLTGAASGGIAKQLQKHGAHLVVRPASFRVAAKVGPLVEGEVERAHAWAQHILAAVGNRENTAKAKAPTLTSV
ncbi:MAG TPA: flavodoxin domain-containing protein [Chloroflexota bacterium]|jgi:flavodoxin